MMRSNERDKTMNDFAANFDMSGLTTDYVMISYGRFTYHDNLNLNVAIELFEGSQTVEIQLMNHDNREMLRFANRDDLLEAVTNHMKSMLLLDSVFEVTWCESGAQSEDLLTLDLSFTE